MSSSSQPFLTIWRLSDGKPGHDKQSLGLCHALARLTPARCIDIRVHGGWKALVHWLAGRFPEGRHLPRPQLLVGAGHATHLPLLAARRARGGKAVVVMRPSLPLGLFDLCLIPEHDRPPRRGNVIATRGALNDVVPGTARDATRGLILVGGPSPHFRWDGDAVLRQARALAAARPELHWTLSTSRRTPEGFLAGLVDSGIACVDAAATPPGWLEAQLAGAGEAWITPDSVSMVYEALTAGCRVGLFDLTAVPGSRVAAGIAALSAHGYVAPTPDVRPAPPPQPLAEAERCARLILERDLA
ncbi:MAG: mitochondrial fission ELM1 family protein [Pseudomonadota bacterium]